MSRPRYPDSAAGWMALLLRSEVSTEDRQAFEAWRREQSADQHELGALTRAWLAAGELGEDLALVESRATIERGPSMGRRRLARRLSGLAATVALVAAIMLFNVGGEGELIEHYTAPGEQQLVRLADGSTIQLNSASRLQLEPASRQVRLLAGEAFFVVEPQRGGQLSVDAGAGIVRVLGTEFNVLKQPRGLLVSVFEGEVAVDFPGRDGAPSTRWIGGGQSLAIDGSGGARLGAANADLARVQAWRDGRVEFDRQSLEQVVLELNRYAPKPLRLVDPALEGLLVSAVFRIDRLADFDSLRFALENSLPVRLEIAADELVLTSVE